MGTIIAMDDDTVTLETKSFRYTVSRRSFEFLQGEINR
jgi:hypothetical protein